MRNLDRDRQRVVLGHFAGLVLEEDAQGRLTGRNVPTYRCVELWPSVSPIRGEAYGTYFGSDVDFDLTLTVDDPALEAAEADVLWVYKPEEGPHDYTVRRVARKGGFTVIAAKHVELS